MLSRMTVLRMWRWRNHWALDEDRRGILRGPSQQAEQDCFHSIKCKIGHEISYSKSCIGTNRLCPDQRRTRCTLTETRRLILEIYDIIVQCICCI